MMILFDRIQPLKIERKKRDAAYQRFRLLESLKGRESADVARAWEVKEK